MKMKSTQFLLFLLLVGATSASYTDASSQEEIYMNWDDLEWELLKPKPRFNQNDTWTRDGKKEVYCNGCDALVNAVMEDAVTQCTFSPFSKEHTMFIGKQLVCTFLWTETNVSCSNSNVTCSGCEFVVELIKYDLQDANKTVAEVEAAVKLLCSLISPIVAPACDAVLKEIDQVIQWILKGMYPVPEICQKLHMCP